MLTNHRSITRSDSSNVNTNTQSPSEAVATLTATILATLAPTIAAEIERAFSAQNLPNVVVQPEAGSVKAAPVAANGKPVVFRSKPGKEAAKAACHELSVRYDLKVVGGSRAFKSLSAKEQAAYRAESKAIWAAVPVTRTTKA